MMDERDEEVLRRIAPFQSPLNNYGKSSILLITNPQDELMDIELALRNVYENEKKELVPLGSPFLNDEGINAIMGSIRSVVNRTGIMTDITEKEVYLLLRPFVANLTKNLMVNKYKWGIKKPFNSSRDYVLNLSINIVWLSLHRAVEGGEKRFWKGSQIEQYQHISNDDQRKPGGFISRFNPFRRR